MPRLRAREGSSSLVIKRVLRQPVRPLTRHEDRQRARHGLTDTRSSIGDRGSNTTRTGAWPANRDNSGTRRKPGGAPAALPRPPRPVRALFRHWPDVAAARGERSPIEPISLVRRSTETPRMSKTVERPRSPVPGQLGRTEASATSIGRRGRDCAEGGIRRGAYAQIEAPRLARRTTRRWCPASSPANSLYATGCADGSISWTQGRSATTTTTSTTAIPWRPLTRHEDRQRARHRPY